MYKLISVGSMFCRNLILPNPFESLEYGALINFALDPILWFTTYKIVGLFYERRSAPVIGSLLYLLFYSFHTGLIMICGRFGFSTLSIIIILVLYIAILFGLIKMRNKLCWGWY